MSALDPANILVQDALQMLKFFAGTVECLKQKSLSPRATGVIF
jgi:hypothetical protein